MIHGTTVTLPRESKQGAALTRSAAFLGTSKEARGGIQFVRENRLKARRTRCRPEGWRYICRYVAAAVIGVTTALVGAASAPARQKQEEAQSPAAQRKQEENEKSPRATHYVRTLGPFALDGRNFAVKLSVTCYKETPHAGMCNEDDQEAVRSLKIEDDAGKTRFSESFPVGFMHQLERHVVEVTLLEGREHQALEIVDTRLPSHANTGATIQLFGVRDGALRALNEEPLEFYGVLGKLPPGTAKNSKALLAGDVLPIYVMTNYFYVVSPVRIDWQKFRVAQQESGELDVVQQPPYQRKPDIEGDGFIHVYPSPDENATPQGVSVGPRSSVQVLKALFRKGPPEEHDRPSDVWLQISVDGKVGWILGLDDYTAIGLSPAQ